MVLLDMSIKDCTLQFGEHSVPYLVFPPDEPYFRGRSLTNALSYVSSARALERLTPRFRSSLSELFDTKGTPNASAFLSNVQCHPTDFGGELTQPPLDHNDAKSTWVNEQGLYQLILGSEKEEAEQFKEWVVSEVLPSIRKTGSFSFGLHAEEKALMMVYKERRVLYMGSIGLHDGQELVKFGTTENIARRTSENKRDFQNFRLKVVIATENHKAVEDAFKAHDAINVVRTKKTINGKTHTELFVTSDRFTLEDAEAVAKLLAIEQDITGSGNTRRLMAHVQQDVTRQREKEQHLLEMRRLDLENRRIDLEMRKLDLQSQKLSKMDEAQEVASLAEQGCTESEVTGTRQNAEQTCPAHDVADAAQTVQPGDPSRHVSRSNFVSFDLPCDDTRSFSGIQRTDERGVVLAEFATVGRAAASVDARADQISRAIKKRTSLKGCWWRIKPVTISFDPSTLISRSGQARSVEQTSMDGQVIHIYNSTKEVAAILNVNTSTLLRAMQEGATYKGYRWRQL